MATKFQRELSLPSQSDRESLLDAVTIHDSDDILNAARAVKKMADELGFRASLCADIASREPMIDAEGTILTADVFGWINDGERWWEDHQLALHSPLPRSCRYESEPFWCNREGFHGTFHNPYLDEIRIADFFESGFTYGAAILIPIHLPFGQISANSFLPFDKSQTDLTEEFTAFGDLLSSVTRRFIAGYVSAMRKKRRMPSDCELSKREVECLRWAALGKTDREIGIIINLSHATVRYHVNRASEKLDSVNRAQTIFKAGQLGYLGASR